MRARDRKISKKNLVNNEIVIGMGAGSISMWMKKISVNYKKYAAKNKKKILDLKKNCWIGTGGIASNTFFPEDEKDLLNYLKIKNNKKNFYFRKWIKYSFQRQRILRKNNQIGERV